MKAKKAVKRLHRVETLLGTIIDRYEAETPVVHDLLDAARNSVASATQALDSSPSGKPARTKRAAPSRTPSKAGRKRLSVAAKNDGR